MRRLDTIANASDARIITDDATVVWLCDVSMAPAHRDQGLGTRLAQAVVEELRPWGLSWILLVAADAHELQAGAEFTPMPDPNTLRILSPS